MPAHALTIRVRYAESDQMGLAHHGAYITWFEAARIEWLRCIGHSYRQLELDGVLMPVTELTVRYKRSLRFDDEAILTTTATVTGPTRMTFRTVVTHGDVLCAEAEVTVAAVNRDGRPIRLPADIVEQAGKP